MKKLPERWRVKASPIVLKWLLSQGIVPSRLAWVFGDDAGLCVSNILLHPGYIEITQKQFEKFVLKAGKES